MWRDRLAGHPGASETSTPNRQPSPAPRQSQAGVKNKPIRPPYSSQSSLLSLSSTPNESTNSLPGTLPQSNKLGGKLGEAAVKDPRDALESIIGSKPKSRGHNNGDKAVDSLKKPESLIDSIDFGDRSLGEFVQQKDSLLELSDRQHASQSAQQCETHSIICTITREPG